MLKQLSIYAENKKGVMQNITGILRTRISTFWAL